MSNIRIDVGVYTALDVDLSGFDFSGVEKVVLTVKNKNSEEVLILREFTTPAVHTVTVTPQESTSLSNGAIYDFNVITADGKRYKNGENGAIQLRKGVGAWTDSSE